MLVLALNYDSYLTLIRVMSNIETNMVSVERLKEYDDEMPSEAPHKMPEQGFTYKTF